MHCFASLHGLACRHSVVFVYTDEEISVGTRMVGGTHHHGAGVAQCFENPAIGGTALLECLFHRPLLGTETASPHHLVAAEIVGDGHIKRRAAQLCDFRLHLPFASIPCIHFSGRGAAVDRLLLCSSITTQHFFVDITLVYAIRQSQARAAQQYRRQCAYHHIHHRCLFHLAAPVLKKGKGVAVGRIVTNNKIL